jgi:DNA polymerase III subunit alpha
MGRVELHSHSHYSLMDGLNTPAEMAKVAREFDMPALSITDHGTLSGHRDLQRACKDEGIKPILGVEAYISPTDRFDRRPVEKRDDNTQLYNHVVLLAKDEPGLKNLHHMSREAWQSGYYYKPRVDWELLSEYGDGIIVLSGCMNGLIAKAHERGELDEAERLAKQYVDRFGDDFYMEIQAHNREGLNEYLIQLAQRYGIKPVATTDCHFTRPELRWVEEAMLILSTSPKQAKGVTYADTRGIKDVFERFRALYPERPISFEDIDVYLMNRRELEDAFEKSVDDVAAHVYDQAIDTSLEIADKIGDYDFVEGEDFLPRIATNPDKVLRSKVKAGLVSKGLFDNPEYRERAEQELATLSGKNFAPYFLIVEDIVRWARENNIMVGPGRGSAAGSLVCYALDITQVDPIHYNLLFFRFIDEERDDWPDIDLDFEQGRRGEVKEYIRRKYGHVASISNFNYFKDKGVVRDAARVYGVPIAEVNKALKQVEKWDDFLTTAATDTMTFRGKYPEVIELAEHLRGRIRSVGMHAAGVVTSNVPIEDFAPFETRPDPNDKASGRVPVVAWDMKQCESAGLIKLDILGLAGLDITHHTTDEVPGIVHDVTVLKRVADDAGVALTELPLDDPKVFKAFADGHTQGVFQADGATNRTFLMKIVPTEFEDLVAATSLARPGAMNTVGEVFLDRKHGREPVTYVHDMMEEFLKDTYGTIVYQEQVMLAAVHLGGMSWGDANHLRRIIGKKKDAREFEQYKDRFMTGATKHISQEAADSLWHDFEAHAGYSFNRSHAVAYTMITYWMMYLKLYYPLQFMTALLRHESDKDKRVEILIEMRRLGLTVKMPHINLSGEHAEVRGDHVRLGLTDIKYISDKVFRKLDKARPFETYADLMAAKERKGSGINSRAIAAMNAVGAATFTDNPKTGDESDNYYEYLRIPKFAGRDLPWEVLETITTLDEYSEEDTLIVKAMVTSLKRGKTKVGKEWVRVEMVDETGKAGIFCDPAGTPEPGQMYVFLVAYNRIMRSIPIDEFGPENDDPFVRFMYNEGERPGVGHIEVLAVEKRFTAKKQMMATIVAANSKRKMRRVLVFPKTFGRNVGKLQVGSVHRAKISTLKDGTLSLQELG